MYELGRKVQELFVRVGGVHRKVDGGKLRHMVKEMGLGEKETMVGGWGKR